MFRVPFIINNTTYSQCSTTATATSARNLPFVHRNHGRRRRRRTRRGSSFDFANRRTVSSKASSDWNKPTDGDGDDDNDENAREWEEVLPQETANDEEEQKTARISAGRKLAISAFVTGTCAFLTGYDVGDSTVFRTFSNSSNNNNSAIAAQSGSLSKLEKESIDIDEALKNSKPTVLEFYADWCEVCKSSAPYVYDVERSAKADVNFVMMNIDNVKWTQEMDDYDVDGIPHLEFLDKDNLSKGALIGKFPKEVLIANIESLKTGEEKLPYAKQRFQSSAVQQKSIVDEQPGLSDARGAVDPRAHG